MPPLAPLCLWACAPTTEAVTDGLVSTSLCGDAYALEAGDPAALSWQSAGPLGSGWAGPRASSDPERLVALDPARLLLGPGERVPEAVTRGRRVAALDWGEDFEGVARNRGYVAELLNDSPFPDEETVPGSPSVPATPPTALYLSRAGGTAGPGTYVDAAIRAAGGRNLVEAPGWFTPDPEWLLAQDADVVVVSFLDGYESATAPLARNRAVQRWLERRRTVEVPGRLWPCAGPGLEQAVEVLREGFGEG